LGLDLHLFSDKTFRFYDPISNQILRSHAETEHARYQAELALSQTELERLYEHQARLEAEAAQQQAEAIANQERLAKQQAEEIANQERQKNETLMAYLRSIGVNPDDL
jgi:glucokinase